MRLYLDTSALVKLYVQEEGSSIVRGEVEKASLVATCAIAYVEARSAFARRRREGRLPPGEHRRVIRDLDADWEHYFLLDVTPSLIRQAAKIAEVHRLRAYDAVHLASAALFKERLAGSVTHFLCWDNDLTAAAALEGFKISPRQHS